MEKKITDFLIRNGNAKEEQRELVEFGLKQGFITLFNYSSVLLMGILFNMIFEAIIFSIAFSNLRKYVGGYHTRGPLSCYFLSMSMFLVVLLMIKYITINNLILLGLSSICWTIIFLLAPIGDENKELDQLEIVVYRKKSRVVLIVEIVVAIVFLTMKLKNFYYCMVFSFLTVGISLAIAKIKLSIKIKK